MSNTHPKIDERPKYDADLITIPILKELIKKTVPIGFIFGMLFSIYAFIYAYDFNLYLLLLIPFLAGLFSGLGALIATVTSNILTKQTTLPKTTVQILSFFAAAIINTLLVLVIFISRDINFLHHEAYVGIFVGLGVGAVYAVYSYKVASMQEKMEFLEALAEKNKQLQETSRKLAITEERNRMGRELHDSVSQGLFGLVFALRSLRNEMPTPSERVSSILDHMDATANSTLDELRTMIEELKPSLLMEQGLEKAIYVMTDLFSQRQQVPVKLQLQVPDNLSATIEMAIYRITQESLGNIEKHAAAELVSFTLYIEKDNVLVLQISDDGKGFANENHNNIGSGNGLNNMRQRAEELDGTFEVISKINYGTTIIAKFPL